MGFNSLLCLKTRLVVVRGLQNYFTLWFHKKMCASPSIVMGDCSCGRPQSRVLARSSKNAPNSTQMDVWKREREQLKHQSLEIMTIETKFEPLLVYILCFNRFSFCILLYSGFVLVFLCNLCHFSNLSSHPLVVVAHSVIQTHLFLVLVFNTRNIWTSLFARRQHPRPML